MSQQDREEVSILHKKRLLNNNGYYSIVISDPSSQSKLVFTEKGFLRSQNEDLETSYSKKREWLVSDSDFEKEFTFEESCVQIVCLKNVHLERKREDENKNEYSILFHMKFIDAMASFWTFMLCCRKKKLNFPLSLQIHLLEMINGLKPVYFGILGGATRTGSQNCFLSTPVYLRWSSNQNIEL
jgi:hypothetical protein